MARRSYPGEAPVAQRWVNGERIFLVGAPAPARVLEKLFTADDLTTMLREQREFYGDKRGWEKGTGKYIIVAKNFPRTTSADVIELFNYWDARFDGRRWKHKAQYIKNVGDAGWKEQFREDERWRSVRRWLLRLTPIITATDTLSEEFGGNERFWDALTRLARHLTIQQSTATSYKLYKQAVGEAVRELKERARQLLNVIPWGKIAVAAGIVGALWVTVEVAKARRPR